MSKKKIVILGSTGSIGKTTYKIISKDKKTFEIKLLTTNTNYKLIIDQAKRMNVKNIIITDKKNYLIAKKNIRIEKSKFITVLKKLKKFLKKK